MTGASPPSPVVPAIECDVRAGKINLQEFIAKCPANCKETTQPVYGTGVFASMSSVCNAAIHSGVITNSGGKVIVRKTAGQASYKGSFSNGIRSLSLPKWRESFVVEVGKPKKGAVYPSTLDYTASKPTSVKTGSKAASAASPATTAPEPITTAAPEPTSAAATTTPPTTPTTTAPPATATTVKPRAAVHKVRDAGESGESGDSSCSLWLSGGLGVINGPCLAGSAQSNASLRPSGFVVQEQDSLPRALEPISQGDPSMSYILNTSCIPSLSFFPVFQPRSREKMSVCLCNVSVDCKVDIAFLMDGSWSIGKRRFKIQKDFLTEVSQIINVGVAGPMMGIIQYGDDAVTEFSLKAYASSRDLKPAIDKIIQKGGLSNVGKALSFVNKHYFSDANGNRGGAPNVAVVLVDGWPTDRVEEASRLARESGINIFFVTIEGPDDDEKQNVVEANFVEKAVCRTNGFFSLPVSSWFGLRKAVQPLVKRVCDTDRLVCSKTCLNANDIAFVIDGSSSVGTGNFRTVLQFVANITREFEISDTDTRVGAVQYTYEQRLEFAFGQHNTKAELLNAIKRINYWSGGTSTGAAITYAAEQLFSKSKPNKRKIMIVITDGRSYDDVRAPALAVQRKGVIAYSIGIAWAAQDELEYIATDPDKDHSFFVDEFDSLYKFVPKITHSICQEFNSQPRN
uniref:Cochlin n=1 Tax=Denticeps clupeoides TaxID=299321 RepID=A0AAY4C4C5_9TELE